MNSPDTARVLHRDCVICGQNHPTGLCLNFIRQADGSVRAESRITDRFQGYNGLVHGGVIASLLDAAMTHCLLQQGIPALTAELTIRFREPLPVGRQVVVQARLTRQRPPLYHLKAELSLAQKVVAHAEASFMLNARPLANCGN